MIAYRFEETNRDGRRASGGPDAKESRMIDSGKRVRVLYEGRFDDGEVFDSSQLHGGEPLEFVVGAGQMIAGFDAAVADMELGGKRTVTIPAAEAYGEYDPQMKQTVPADRLPNADRLPVGERVMLNMGGRMAQAKVESVGDGQIVFDFNHELAGKDLTFDIEVVEVLD